MKATITVTGGPPADAQTSVNESNDELEPEKARVEDS